MLVELATLKGTSTPFDIPRCLRQLDVVGDGSSSN
jgi:hypothetical protein